MALMLLMDAALSAACSRDDCGRWDAEQVDPRLRTFTYQIAVGVDGALAEIGPGGYEPRDSGTSQDLLAVSANRYWTACRTYVVVGRAGTIRVAQGEGEPWYAPASEEVAADLRGVAYSCLPVDFGVAVGDGGTVLVGASQGSQWKSAASPTTRRLNAVAIDRKGRALAVGEQGTVIRSFDSGATWEPVHVEVDTELLSIWLESDYVSETGGYAVQGYITGVDGALLYSPDGMSWERVESGSNEDLRQVITHAEERGGTRWPLILGDTRLFTWSPGQPGITSRHDLRRRLLAVADYFNIRVLAEGGVLLEYREPYRCELSHD